MLFSSNPRPAWLADPSGPLRTLPAGAREAPLDWACTVQVEERGHFDKDAQGPVFTELRTVTGWRAEPDPRLHHAGSLSFHGIDVLATGVVSAFPGPERFGRGLTALTMEGHQLHPRALEWIGRSRAWEDLSLWCARWSAPSRGAGMRELGPAFPALRGLELHSASLDPADLAALASAPFLERLEDLTLTNRPLDPPAVLALVGRLGSLVHLDLSESRLGPKVVRALAPKLRRARRLRLAGNPIGDKGVRALLEAGALERVEDLWLSGCELTDTSAFALAQAALPRLRGLWIGANRLTDAGVEALIRSPLFARLEGASLDQRGLTPRAATLLEGHPLAGALTGGARLPGLVAMYFLGRPQGPSSEVQ